LVRVNADNLGKEGALMAKLKDVKRGLAMLVLDFDKQLEPGSFEHALCHMVDQGLDLSGLLARINNDTAGAPAYDPAVLLKIVLLAYSRGIISSRKMEAACRDNVMFMVVSGESRPDHSTLAAFVSKLGDEVAKLFAQVLVLCDRQGLIGREMFAIDGVKLPSNASKARSGTRADFQRQLDRMEKQTQQMIQAHRQADASPDSEDARQARKLQRLQRDAEQLRQWLKDNPKDRMGTQGKPILSNLTDNESAKMATDKGVIQGYTGVATVDDKHQIVVDAQAFGTGSENALLVPVVDATQHLRTPDTQLTADAGYHSKAGLEHLHQQGVQAFIADNNYRQRDPRYAQQHVHKDKASPLHDKQPKQAKIKIFKPEDFNWDESTNTCICPAGKQLYSHGSDCTIKGYAAVKFHGAKRDCGPCAIRAQCLRKPDKTPARQVAFMRGKRPTDTPDVLTMMRQRIDSHEGKRMITRRFATVEPVFGNLRYNKRLSRFTLRGKTKVDGQFKLYAMMHNIEKFAGSDYAQ
jgi:transposase